MSIRISEGGRLFGIMAGLGGAAMILSAGLPWITAVGFAPDYHDVGELRDADRAAMLVLGLFVIAGAACFITFGSRWMRMTAGALVVLAAAAGFIIALEELTGTPVELELPCNRPPCIEGIRGGGGRMVGALGAILAAGYGIVALLRSGWEAPLILAAERPAGAPSGAGRAEHPTTPHEPPMSDADVPGWTLVDFGTPPKLRMSDASLLGLTVLVLVIALVVGFFVAINIILSHDSL